MSTDNSSRRFSGKLFHAMVSRSRRRGGSHDTRERRECECKRFCIWLFIKNLQYRDPTGIKDGVVLQYFRELVDQGLSLGTLQNRASYLRAVLPNFKISNEELGISGRNRHGKREPCPQWLYDYALISVGDDWAKAMLMLQRHLGLRIQEAIRSGPSISSWVKQLYKGDTVHIVLGTKGGRPRLTQVPDRGQALKAVIFSQRILKENRRQYIVPSSTQKSAKSLYYARLHKVGIKRRWSSHSLRYSFACELLEKYAREGYSEREAYSLVSQSLGHGDGRGAYVRSVYCLFMPPYDELRMKLRKQEYQRMLKQRFPRQFAVYDARWCVKGEVSALGTYRKDSQALVDL